jgi:hypothetical protein
MSGVAPSGIDDMPASTVLAYGDTGEAEFVDLSLY